MATKYDNASPVGNKDFAASLSLDGSLVAAEEGAGTAIDVFNIINQSLVRTIPGTTGLPTLSGNGAFVSFVQTNGGVATLKEENVATGVSFSYATSTSTLENSGISQDGKVIAFDTNSNPLKLGGNANGFQAYAVNTESGLITLMSQNNGVIAGNDAKGNPSSSLTNGISEDGSTVTFQSTALNLVAGLNTNDLSEVYINNQAGTALRIASTTANGTIADRTSQFGSLSASGNQVAFVSDADNLGYVGPVGYNEVYVRNFSNNTLTLASSLSDGTAATGPANGGGVTNAVISPDGRFVAFASDATNLPGANHFSQIYLKDLSNGQLTLLSQDASGNAGNGNSSLPAFGPEVFSSDDSQIVFNTTATNLQVGGSGVVRATVPVTPITPVVPPSPGVTFSSVAFTDTGVLGDGITNNPTVKLSGAETNATKVEVFDGNTDLGPATIAADGTWSLTTNLAQGSHSAFKAVASNGGANTASATNSTSVTVNTTAPIIAFNPTVTFANANTATLTGTVTDALGTKVEIFQGTKDLGAATVDPTAGTFTFQSTFSSGFHSGLTALATDAAGNTATVPTDFDLTTGIKKGAVKASIDNYNSTADYLGSTYFNANGTVNLQFKASELPNGNFVNAYTQGTSLRPLGLSSYTTTLKHNGDLVSNVLNVIAGGTHTLSGMGGFDTFVFKPHFGSDTITDFNPIGAGHDVLNLPKAEFANLASVLASSSQQGSDTVIAAKNGDTVTLQNVALKELGQSDFKFHA